MKGWDATQPDGLPEGVASCPTCGALPCDWVDAPSRWLAIESAPKDREVLLYCGETGEFFVAFWGTDPEDGDQQWVFARSPSVSFIVRDPTHWSELPTPPEGGAA